MEPQQILICNEPSPMSPSPPSTSMAMKMSTTTTTSITAHTRIRLDSSLSSTSTTSTISSIRGDRSITNLFDSPNSSSSGYDSNLSTMSQHSFDDDFDDEIENDENLGRNHHHHHPHHHHPRQQTRSSINDGSNNDPFVIAGKLDLHMLDDNQRILRNLLSIEDRCIPWNVDTIVYQSTQYQITDSIRSELIDWMFEVCEAFRCEEGIFALSVNYLDRILLAIPTLPKSQLQLTAVVCMLIASKIRQCTVMDPIDLSVATDHTCSVSDILIWEPIILKRLNWDVSSVIATDYLDSILLFVEKILKRFVCEQKPKQEQNSQMKFDQSNLEDDFDDGFDNDHRVAVMYHHHLHHHHHHYHHQNHNHHHHNRNDEKILQNHQTTIVDCSDRCYESILSHHNYCRKFIDENLETLQSNANTTIISQKRKLPTILDRSRKRSRFTLTNYPYNQNQNQNLNPHHHHHNLSNPLDHHQHHQNQQHPYFGANEIEDFDRKSFNLIENSEIIQNDCFGSVLESKCDNLDHYRVSNSLQSPLTLSSSSSSSSPSSSSTLLTRSSASLLSELIEIVRRHSNVLIDICSTDSQFISIKPSIIAAACVAAALQNISNDFNESDTISDEILGDRIESIRQSTSSTTDYNNQFSMNIVKILRKKFSTTKSMRNLKLPIMFYKMFLITIEQQMGIDSVLLENFIEKIQNLAWSKIGIRLIDYNCYESKRSINKMISSKEESCSVISSFANANIVSELSKISTDQEQHRKLLMLNDEDTTIYTLLPSSPSSQSPPSSQSFDRVKFFLYEDHFVLKPKSWSFF